MYTLNDKPLKWVGKFTYFDSNISSTENDVNIDIGKTLTTINGLLIIWKSDLSNKIECKYYTLNKVDINFSGGCTFMW